MKYTKNIIIAVFAIAIIGTPWIIENFPRQVVYIDNIFSYANTTTEKITTDIKEGIKDTWVENLAAVFFRESVTVDQLKSKYDAVSQTSSKIKILIVPGHEPDYGGTEFNGIKEREMAVALAVYLNDLFKNNSHYEVYMTRDNEKWNTEFSEYFKNNWNEILSFISSSKSNMVRLINNGSVKNKVDGVYHNNVAANVGTRLYGINKWANENKIDMVIHVHFNDVPRRNTSISGDYTGLSIYVPERQYSNSTTTKAIADKVYKRLTKYNATSNLKNEDDGVVEEQELIAIGSFNTLDAPSMLIEYGYIYEPQFSEKNIRDITLKDMAFQTYLGVQDFFGGGNDVTLTYDTLLLPFDFSKNFNKDSKDNNEILALQSALILEGLYPPKNKTKNDCPRSGRFGPCTIGALSQFQKDNLIKGENEMVGNETRRVLNGKYSLKLR